MLGAQSIKTGPRNSFGLFSSLFISCRRSEEEGYGTLFKGQEELSTRGNTYAKLWRIVSQSTSSVTQSCLTLWNSMDSAGQTSQSIINSWSLLKLMSTELVVPSNHLLLCHPLLLLPSILPSTRDFSNESVLHIMWPKYWSFSFSISPSNEYSGLISFRIDWFDLLVVQSQSLWLCGSQQTVDNSSRDGNTRPPYLPPEKFVCRSRNYS